MASTSYILGLSLNLMALGRCPENTTLPADNAQNDFRNQLSLMIFFNLTFGLFTYILRCSLLLSNFRIPQSNN